MNNPNSLAQLLSTLTALNSSIAPPPLSAPQPQVPTPTTSASNASRFHFLDPNLVAAVRSEYEQRQQQQVQSAQAGVYRPFPPLQQQLQAPPANALEISLLERLQQTQQQLYQNQTVQQPSQPLAFSTPSQQPQPAVQTASIANLGLSVSQPPSVPEQSYAHSIYGVHQVHQNTSNLSTSTSENTLNKPIPANTYRTYDVSTPYQIDSVDEPSQESEAPSPSTSSLPALDDKVVNSSPTKKKAFGPASGGITPAVLSELARLCGDGQNDIVEQIQNLQSMQKNMEDKLLRNREALLERHEKRRQELLASEIIGNADPREAEALEVSLARELSEFDKTVIRELENLAKKQQAKLDEIGIPMLYVTDKPEDMTVQKKIISLILDMTKASG
ncbi:Protein dgcr6 [Quaeritorhiza haematococci]|nr:Protein dgcr6 [Quaeritorhiza haematococci]